MVNFYYPVELRRHYVALMNFWTVVDGLYIWELSVTLDYEWSVIQGRRPYHWTIWIYSAARLATLMAVVMNLIAFNTSTLTNCQVLVSFSFIFPGIAFLLSSLLILNRIAAIWNRNTAAVALATGVWATNIPIIILGGTRIRSTWLHAQQSCSLPNVVSNKLTVITTLAADLALLLIMLVGLFCLRRCGGSWFDLRHLLWKQGVGWLLLATISQLVPVVFMYLNLNDAFDTMFLMPALVIMSIAATRLYCSTVDSGLLTCFAKSSKNVRRRSRPLSRADLSVDARTRVEVAVHTTHEQHLTSPKDENFSLASLKGHLCDKSRELSPREDADSNV